MVVIKINYASASPIYAKVVYGTGEGADTVWGSIIGTLSDQVDLQNALNAKQDDITLTTTGTSGPATFVGNVLNIPQYEAEGSYVTTGTTITINGVTYDLSANRTWNVGSVTSVDMSVPTGLTISGNPITSNGTLALGLAAGYSIPTDVNQANWTAAYNDKINSAAVTGTSTKTLTLTQQDGGTITASWSDVDTAPVTSVFGRTGDVIAVNGDYTTTLVTEGTNLYFTDARARNAISLTTIGSNGAATYSSGVFNIPNYTLSGLGGVPLTRTITINGTTYDLSNDRTWTIPTHDAVTIGTANGLSLSGQILSLGLASAVANGALSSTDWTNFEAAYNDKINSAAVTGTSTKTLTLTQQDGGTITASWSDISTDAVTSVFGRTGDVIAVEGDYTLTQLGDVTITSPSNGQVLKYNGTTWINNADTDTGLTSVGLTMPSAFSVANSPLTANGTIAVTGAGTAIQYVRGDGSLADFPTVPGGGGGGRIYYFNGNTVQGTFLGLTMYELGETASTGAAADFTASVTGTLANFITDANVPNLTKIPAGVWTLDCYLSESGGGANHAELYAQLEVWNGTTATLISTSPLEQITEGSFPSLYTFDISVPETTISATDRIIIQFYIQNTNGKTVTLYTENGKIAEVHTTFTTGVGTLNGLTTPTQYLAVGTSGTDFNISSVTATHTFNLPTASATNRGALSSADWSAFNSKQGALTLTTTGTSGAATLIGNTLNIPQYEAEGNYVTTSTTLTINGVTYDLSANRTWTISSHDPVTIGTANGLSLSDQVLSLGLASASTNGALSSTDWSTFNSKQNAIVNPVTGTGATNQLAYWTSSSEIDNLDTATYPSLTEISYVKGVTSAIQTQLDNKQSVITLTTTGSSGSSTFVSNTLNVPTYTLTGLGGVPTTRQITINGVSQDLSADRSWTVGGVSSITASAPLTGGTITTSGSIGITLATASTDGYLSSTDWNTFNNKLSTAITSLNGLTTGTQTFAVGTSGSDFTISSAAGVHTFNLPSASASNRGALTSSDWTTFNNKQGAITLTTTGTSGAATLVGNTLNIPQYGGGGGASIGGAVTSGTTGSILFINPTATLAQDNANLFWDDTNNRLGVAINVPLYRLDINGTGRYQDNLLVSKNGNASTSLTISNTTSGTSGAAILTLTSDASSGNANFGKYSTTTTAYKIVASKDAYLYNGTTGGDISILNDFATGTIKFAAGGSSTAHVTIGTTGLTTFATGVVYKRLNPTAIADNTGSFTPDISATDTFTISPIGGIAFYNPTGTPVNGQKFTVRIKNTSGGGSGITFSGTQYRASTDLPFPSSVANGKTMYLGFMYNATDNKWDMLALLNNF